jgi:hypothetical protein
LLTIKKRPHSTSAGDAERPFSPVASSGHRYSENVMPLLKGIVQRKLTWVETKLKRSVLMNYIVAKFDF